MRERSSRGSRNWSEAVAEAGRILRRQAEKNLRIWKWLYKLCTISWLSLWVKLLQIVGLMGFRISVFVSGVMLMSGMTVPAIAQDKIQSFVNSNGKVVYTNLVDNTPTAPVTSTSNDAPAQEMPSSLSRLVDTISSNHGVDPALVRAVIKTESNF